MVPKRCFFTTGVGFHKDKLGSFEMALRDAGIEKYNLVSVSSILPPECEIIPKDEGLKELHAGAIVFCVMSRIDSDEPHRLLSAAVGVAQPVKTSLYGYLSEYHPYGKTEEECGDYAEDLAAEMFASSLGLEIDVDKAYLEKEDLWMIGPERVKTLHIARAASPQNGSWCSVLASCVFLL
ncbi:MAG: arginine decarboxylase, pyruvoyl-dependent [Armatimonadota bacterium]|nr:arginine decarboxylase, pyruvoyl-dependent [Armatimonadota bacterium]